MAVLPELSEDSHRFGSERLEEMINRGKVLTFRGICNTADAEDWYFGLGSDSDIIKNLLSLRDLGKIEIAMTLPNEGDTHIIYIIPRALIEQPTKK